MCECLISHCNNLWCVLFYPDVLVKIYFISRIVWHLFFPFISGSWALIISFYFRITEEVGNEGDKNLGDEKPVTEAAADGNKENLDNEPGEKEAEEKVNVFSSY